MSKSLISDAKECYVCGSPYVEKHHCYKSHKCRKNADKTGLWVWLCPSHHRELHDNAGKGLDLELMQLGQRIFEETHTREEFREKFIKSYLED